MSMIEQVADALFQRLPISKAEAKQVARFAIEAMREPTPAMVEEGWAEANAENAAGVWRDMIDAALNEPETPREQSGERS